MEQTDQSKAQRRVAKLLSHLAVDESFADVLDAKLHLHLSLTASGQRKLRIGDVTLDLELPDPGLEHLVPVGYATTQDGSRSNENQDTLRTLRFMMQKDNLGQDVYLLGPPGAMRRSIAYKYCELAQRPVEYVSLSQDTTESDLKQRREITAGTAEYIDCAAVRAAICGSILILDGIEKAERNVMPLLNNLLENREMALEDGRFLVSPKRYDALLQDHSEEEMRAWKLVRTSHRFRVIALGLPVPHYVGNPLDPPFRSRFQARDVSNIRVGQQLEHILRSCNRNTAEQVIQCFVQCMAVLSELRHSEGASANSSIPEFPQGIEISAGLLWKYFPGLHPRIMSDLHYPYPSLLSGATTDDRGHILGKLFDRFGLQVGENLFAPVRQPTPQLTILAPETDTPFPPQDVMDCTVSNIRRVDTTRAQVTFECRDFASGLLPKTSTSANNHHTTLPTQVVVEVPAGDAQLSSFNLDGIQPPKSTSPTVYVLTPSGRQLWTRLLQAHAVGDFCIIGEKGGGKSALVHHFASCLGYHVEHIPLYKDMTARSLLQRRTTQPNGDTSWEDSSLVNAALYGRLALLDGVEQLPAGTLATLQQLVQDRQVSLPNGTMLMTRESFEQIMHRDGLTEEELLARKVLVIHPSFRVIALARPTSAKPGAGAGSWREWLGPEVTCMFRFVFLSPLLENEQRELIQAIAPNLMPSVLDKLMVFVEQLRIAIMKDDMLAALQSTVSLRQLIRITKRLSTSTGTESKQLLELHEALQRAALSRFLPSVVHETLVGLFVSTGIAKSTADHRGSTGNSSSENVQIEVIETGTSKFLQIGDVKTEILPPQDPLLVPNIVFYDNPRQSVIMMEMLKDWNCNQHLLLIGNQGVGKNKIADRMLQLLQLPREYIQLHRDTSVQNLTSNPTIVDGVLMYEDSPLVRAAREGRVLVVDEADKAPTYVTAVLKALVEDHSMLLSDGRRIVDPEAIPANPNREYIPLHPNFRMIALANRPGFPFHGNDFFREVGDVFSSHAIDNPDTESEMYLLKQYGPNVPLATLRKLIAAFDELRRLSDDGQLSYPYSTRELAAIVRHMQEYPSDGIDRILRNVFDFDNYSPDERDMLVNAFTSNGIPFALGMNNLQVNTGKSIPIPQPILREQWHRNGSLDIPVHASKTLPLSSVLRADKGTGNIRWPLQQPQMETSMHHADRPSTIFTEEVFNFHLPQGMVLGATKLPDGSMVLPVRASSLMLYHVNQSLTKCTVYDLHKSLPPEGIYRGIPKISTLFHVPSPHSPYPAGELVVLNPSTGNVFLIDLGPSKSLEYFVSVPTMTPGKTARLASSPNSGDFVVYQVAEKQLSVVRLSSRELVTLDLPFHVQSCCSIASSQWLIVPMFHEQLDQNKQPMCFVMHFRNGGITLTQLKRELIHPETGLVIGPRPGRFAEQPPLESFGAPDEVTPMLQRQVGAIEASTQVLTMLPTAPLEDASGEVAVKSTINSTMVPDSQPVPKPFLALGLGSDIVSGSGTASFYSLSGSSNLKENEESLTESQYRMTTTTYLPESDTVCLVKELSTNLEVEVVLMDVHNNTQRTLVIGLEDDSGAEGTKAGGLSSTKRDDGNAHRFSRVDPVNGISGRHMMRITGNGYSLRRSSIKEAVHRIFVLELEPGKVITIDCLGWCRVWLVEELAIRQAFDDWRKLVGKADHQALEVVYEGEDGEGEGSGKGNGKGEGEGEGEGNGKGKGKGDGEGEGEGEGNGSGSGSGGGEGKLGGGGGGGSMSGKAKGKNADEVAELPDPGSYDYIEIDNPNQGGKMNKDDEDEHEKKVDEVTKQVKKAEMKKMLDAIEMSSPDFEKYNKYKEAVKTEIRELRVVLEGLEARQQERVWMKNQSTGDLDDQKLIDGLTGERSIYKRRSEQAPNNPFFQTLPKRMHFLFDLSMSMSRYAADGRLERSLECAVMLMESLRGFEHKFDVKMSGHSGDTDNFPLVEYGRFPANDKERLAVLKKMHAHAEMCDSGDNTIEAVQSSVREITQQEADEYFTFLISDANLDLYGITFRDFEDLMNMDPRVHVFAIFIATMGDQTTKFEEKLPGKVFTCLDKRTMPKTLKQMFLSAALS